MNSKLDILSSSSIFATNSNVAPYSVISVRTSNRQIQSIGNSSVGANGLSSVVTGGSYSIKRTASFSAIHKDVSQSISYGFDPVYSTSPTSEGTGGSRRGDNPGGNAVGDQTVPVGDMLLPVLAMAAAYIIVKLFRNRKTSQAL